MRLIARGYAALIALVFAYAWFTEIRLQHLPSEHLLLDMLVAAAAMPSTLGVIYLGEAKNVPELVQLSLLSLGAAVQVLAVFAVARFIDKRLRVGRD